MDESTELFGDALLRALARWDMSLSPAQLHLFAVHYQSIVAANRSFNLTRITDPTEAAVKHYADSLAALGLIARSRPGVRALLDVGTGAGFPAVPLAVMKPALAITAIEATRKKADFVERTARSLRLDQLRVMHAHARHWRCDAEFDMVLFRAVGPLASCIKLAARHVAVDGVIGVYKTARLDPVELQDARRAADDHGLSALDPYQYNLELDGELLPRTLFAYRRET